jgi:HEAT repeat protein
MRCEDVTTHLAGCLAGSLTDDELDAIRLHLEACEHCRAEVEALDDTWHRLGTIEPTVVDSASMRARFDAALAGYQDGLSEGGRRGLPLRQRLVSWRPSVAWQLASAAAVLLIGVVIGREAAPVTAEPPDAQIAALREELTDMRQMFALSLLQQQSASDRILGLASTAQLDAPTDEVIAALLDTLTHDPNVNVRLKTVEALGRFAQRDTVRLGALDALPRQTSPLVQIALIDFVLQAAGRESADALRQLSQDAMLDAAVRARAAWGLQQVS